MFQWGNLVEKATEIWFLHVRRSEDTTQRGNPDD